MHLLTYLQRKQEMLENKQRKHDGKLNCLPHPFKRFQAYFAGWLKSMYYLFTANVKIGKTKLVDYLFVYYPIIERIRKNMDIKTHVLYFSFEAFTAEKEYDYYSNLLYNLDNKRVNPWVLQSIDKECPEEILKLLDTSQYQQFIQEYERTVEYIHDIKNPTGIWKYCKEYAEKNGIYNKVKGKQYDAATGEYYDGLVTDKTNPFKWNDPEQYNIVIIDNFANLSIERGWDLKTTIDKMSKYCIELAKFGFLVVGVQHQSQAQEGIENQRMNKVAPSIDGLGDAKTTARDAHFVIGLFSPNRFGIPNYKGYDITQFQDNIRFMSILAGRNIRVNGSLTLPLLFRGDVSQFEELPPCTDEAKIATVLAQLKQEERQILARNKEDNIKDNKNNQLNF